MKKIFQQYLQLLALLFSTSSLLAQETPKVVVGIVIEQMRFDYLAKFKRDFGKDGFYRLINEGTEFSYVNHISAPTLTGPGHASIYTGTVPFYHGIVGDNWYNARTQEEVYCVYDAKHVTVGSSSANGNCSPNKLRTNTIGDILKLSNNGASRVFSVSLKDASAVIPGGKMADGVYWYDAYLGGFITSNYYRSELPEWVTDFNEKNYVKKLMKDDWELKEKEKKYVVSAPDDGFGEVDVFKEGKTTFPHVFDDLTESEKKEKILYTPAGNTLLSKFVEELIDEEKLGAYGVTDMLTISYSSPEFIGSAYGPNSMEIHDTYIRLDQEIEELLKMLDKNIGKGQYLLFLTSDHGVKTNGVLLKNKKIEAGSLQPAVIMDTLRVFSRVTFGSDWIIDRVANNSIYLNLNEIERMDLDYEEVVFKFMRKMRVTFEELASIYPRTELDGFSGMRSTENMILNGAHPALTGDILYTLNANYISQDDLVGTVSGSPYSYDTHVPLFIFGTGISKRRINAPKYIVDIVPTICNAIGILSPEACIGIPLIESN